MDRAAGAWAPGPLTLVKNLDGRPDGPEASDSTEAKLCLVAAYYSTTFCESHVFLERPRGRHRYSLVNPSSIHCVQQFEHVSASPQMARVRDMRDADGRTCALDSSFRGEGGTTGVGILGGQPWGELAG